MAPGSPLHMGGEEAHHRVHGRPNAQPPGTTRPPGGGTWLDIAFVVAVLLAIALLLTFVVLNWSGGSSRFLG